MKNVNARRSKGSGQLELIAGVDVVEVDEVAIEIVVKLIVVFVVVVLFGGGCDEEGGETGPITVIGIIRSSTVSVP
jgi:hypothetical protein